MQTGDLQVPRAPKVVRVPVVRVLAGLSPFAPQVPEDWWDSVLLAPQVPED